MGDRANRSRLLSFMRRMSGQLDLVIELAGLTAAVVLTVLGAANVIELPDSEILGIIVAVLAIKTWFPRFTNLDDTLLADNVRALAEGAAKAG